MIPDAFAWVATIIVLLPIAYFFLTSPTFLLVKLDIPEVGLLLRAHFHGSLLAVGLAGTFGTICLLIAGRPVFAVACGAVAGSAFYARRRFLRAMDLQLSIRTPQAFRRLRRLHWAGMLYTTVLLALVLSSIRYVIAT